MDTYSGGFAALVEHLERTTRLSPLEAERVVEEVLAYFHESLEAFVTRRHAELQGEEPRSSRASSPRPASAVSRRRR